MAAPAIVPGSDPHGNGVAGRPPREFFEAAAKMMINMKSYQSDGHSMFLDCHDWTAKWVERINDMYRTLRTKAVAGVSFPTPSMQQVQIEFRRIETSADVSGGEHVALIVDMSGYFLLIDHTHNQFNLPIDVYRQRQLVCKKHPLIWYAMVTFFQVGSTREDVLGAWMNFLRTKKYVATVSNEPIRYYGANYDFRSAGAIAAEIRRQRMG